MMGDINLDQLIEILPKLIRENDRIKGAIISALAGVVATKDDIAELIKEMDKRFEAMDKRFEAMDKRFEAMDKRFEAVDRRFEAMDKRFEAVDRRLEIMQLDTKRLEQKVDTGFSTILSKLDSLQSQIGKPFEQFARNVVTRILIGEGFSAANIIPKKFIDTEFRVFPDNNVIEIDGYSDDPAVIVEITSILRNQEKAEKFLKKKAYLEDVQKKPFRGFLVAAATEITEHEKLDLIQRLREHRCELINL